MNQKELKKLIESLSKVEKDMVKTREKIMDIKSALRKKVLANNLKILKKI